MSDEENLLLNVKFDKIPDNVPVTPTPIPDPVPDPVPDPNPTPNPNPNPDPNQKSTLNHGKAAMKETGNPMALLLVSLMSIVLIRLRKN